RIRRRILGRILLLSLERSARCRHRGMDKGARWLETGERRSLSGHVALARRLRRRTGAIQEFRRTRSVHRAVAKAPRARSCAGRGRHKDRIATKVAHPCRLREFTQARTLALVLIACGRLAQFLLQSIARERDSCCDRNLLVTTSNHNRFDPVLADCLASWLPSSSSSANAPGKKQRNR